MPYLKIQTNQSVNSNNEQALLQQASALVATELGKPESYVMVNIESSQPMLFAGTNEPTAYMELKSINLAESKTKDLSAALCHLLNTKINIPTERIYIEFTNIPRSMWGWDKSTF